MGLRRLLFDLAHPARPALYPEGIVGLKALDLGCGPTKRPNSLGIDIVPGPAVDHVVDFEREPLPFADGEVGAIFSSHCLEHLRDPMRVMREMTRVAADGAALEIWLPYGWHNEGQLVDHYVLWNEEQFVHISALFPAIWAERLGGTWEISELVFHVEASTLRELIDRGIELRFALKFYRNVVRELGILGRIRRGVPARSVEPVRTLVVRRDDVVRRPLIPRSAKEWPRALWRSLAV